MPSPAQGRDQPLPSVVLYWQKQSMSPSLQAPEEDSGVAGGRD